MLITEKATRPTITRLDLVDHQQPLIVVAEGSKPFEVFLIGDLNTPFTLDGFDEDRDNILIMSCDLLNRLDVIKRDANKAAHQRFKASLNFSIACCRQRGHSAAVKCILCDDDGGLLNAALVSVETSDFDSAFAGFGACISEKHVLHA